MADLMGDRQPIDADAHETISLGSTPELNELQVTRSTVLRYGVAVVSAACALLLTRFFRVVLEPSVFLLFLLAVMVSAWFGGLKPGFVATFFSAWAIGSFLLPQPLGPALNWADALRIMMFVVIATVISALSGSRKRSNEGLREANQAGQALIEAVPLPIIVLDLNANVKSWSPAAKSVFGWTEQEADDLPFPVVPPDGDVFRENLEAVRRGSVLTDCETRCHRKDGSAINISVSAAPSRNRSGEINSIICVIADVTERKRLDDALRESEMRFRSEVQLATDGIVLADGQGTIIQWNEGAKEIFGYAEEEVLGKPLTMLMPESYREAHQHGMKRVRAGGEHRITGRTVEMHGLKRDGTVFPIGLSVASWKSNGATFYSGIIRDISEQKHAEDVLRELSKGLQRSDELKSALLASVSHDLRTPLTSIRTAIDNLLQSDLHWDHQQQKEFHLIISEEAKRLTRLVEDLLDMARIEAGELRLPLQLGSVAEICDNVLDRCEKELRQHRVNIDCSEDLPLVKVDSPMIAEVLTHLVENAAKYSPDGSEIVVTARLESNELLVSVKDQGPGIGTDECDRVFDKFYRSTRLPASANAGTGMGLAIARGIIEAHGGRIWVDSEPNHGAVFKFALHVGDQERNTASCGSFAVSSSDVNELETIVVD